MSIKARFQQQQPPVDIRQINGIAYVFICQNETQGTESYEDNEEQIQETYYEYDYNEICGPTEKLPLEDIQAHPENYLDYAYTEQEEEGEDDRIKNLEGQVNSIMEAIERGVNS